jgi:hypothetical protein
MADPVVDIPKTLGALLLGGLFAALYVPLSMCLDFDLRKVFSLSGGVSVQVLIYFKLYPSDLLRVKTLVVTVWFLDTLHTGFIWSALFHYLIFHFGDRSEVDFIAWNLAITITFTALLTFLVHCFLAHRIWMLSKRNWLLTIPILTLAVLRLVSANATTGEMIRLESFHLFKLGFKWMFTLGLALSSTVDILITVSLFFLLHGSRTGTPSLNIVIDSLIKYAFETGALTTAGTIISMLCWLVMPQNLIFMGIHFVISKCVFFSTVLLLRSHLTFDCVTQSTPLHFL